MKRTLSIVAALAVSALSLTACGGGGGSSSGGSGAVPPVTHTTAPAPPPGTQSADCPTTGPAAASVASGIGTQGLRRGPTSDAGADRYLPGVITVTYASDAAARDIANTARGTSARTADLHLDSLGLRTRVLTVAPSQVAQTIAGLRHVPGVRSVERAQYRHLMSTVNVNDPYYVGFGTREPYFETASIPGQWDMHVIDVAAAWGYYSHIPAIGAPIAVIDTGVDVTHPDLADKISRQECFVTYPSSAAQSSGPYAVDTDGHGTNVAGIADADTNNGFGFAGVAFDAPLLAYRIFPTTPSGGCVDSNNNPQCSTTIIDEVSAINDAVAHGARVINLSLGSDGPLSNCVDSTEENAVEAAIARGVVVVAASGNGKVVNGAKVAQNYLDCPAAYPGVIAVGAEGPAGASNAQAVASYSNWTSAAGAGSGGAYLVAPGGTATSGSDGNDLHFVENITSSEMAGAAAYCRTDYAGQSGDCRGGFAGTSQATPHVAGVASLMLGLQPSLTAAQIAADLCATAQKIGDSNQGCGRVDAAEAVAKALLQ